MIEAFAADKGIRLIANSPTTKLLQLLPQPPLARLDQLNVCMRSAALSEVTSSVLSPFCKPCVPMLRSVSAEIFTYHTPFWLFNLWTPGRHHRYGLSRRLPKINGPMWGVCNGLVNKDTFRIRSDFLWGNVSEVCLWQMYQRFFYFYFFCHCSCNTTNSSDLFIRVTRNSKMTVKASWAPLLTKGSGSISDNRHV